MFVKLTFTCRVTKWHSNICHQCQYLRVQDTILAWKQKKFKTISFRLFTREVVCRSTHSGQVCPKIQHSTLLFR